MNKITTKMKRHVKHELKYEGPTLWVGKDGLTPQVLIEVEKQLNRQRMIKIRILRTALIEETAQVIATRVAQQTKSALVEVRGHVFILYRKRKTAPAQKQEAKSEKKLESIKKDAKSST
jgi:RNA-binding protein